MTNLLGQSSEDENLQIDPNKSYRDELVGEGKKFKDDEAMARGKYEADHLLKIYERRMDQMRADYTKLADEYNAVPKLQELVEKLTKQPLPNDNQNVDEDVKTMKPAYDPNELKSLVSSTVREIRMTEKEEENYRRVEDKLKERWGNNYQSVLKKEIVALGLSDDDVNALARKSPAAFFRQFGLDAETPPQNFQAPPRTGRQTSTFTPNTGEKRTWSYYQKMKKEQPERYKKSETAVQMQQDYLELGQAFEDGDFHQV